jgi:hypothetical protein
LEKNPMAAFTVVDQVLHLDVVTVLLEPVGDLL